MEWDGIPIRRSNRLIREPSPSSPPPNSIDSTPPEETQQTQIHWDEFPDLGPGIPTIPLADTECKFNPDYLESQENLQAHNSSDGYAIESEDSDSDRHEGGGLEALLWPPELLLRAQSYGSKMHYRQGRDDRREKEMGERRRGAGPSTEGGGGDNVAASEEGGLGMHAAQSACDSLFGLGGVAASGASADGQGGDHMGGGVDRKDGRVVQIDVRPGSGRPPSRTWRPRRSRITSR